MCHLAPDSPHTLSVWVSFALAGCQCHRQRLQFCQYQVPPIAPSVLLTEDSALVKLASFHQTSPTNLSSVQPKCDFRPVADTSMPTVVLVLDARLLAIG